MPKVPVDTVALFINIGYIGGGRTGTAKIINFSNSKSFASSPDINITVTKSPDLSIIKSDKKRRYYVLEYEVEYEVEEKGKYFENYFGTNCGRFVVKIDYPLYMSPPVVYEVNLETDEVIRYKTQPTVERIKKTRIGNGKRNIATWMKRDIIQGQSFRFEWK